MWASHPIELDGGGAFADLRPREGEEAWGVLVAGDARGGWAPDRARVELERAEDYWRSWLRDLAYDGPRRIGSGARP